MFNYELVIVFSYVSTFLYVTVENVKLSREQK